ncbi:MAG: binding domain protein [Rhodospirillales bacterium]|nr:binding domain protein [Rhodospirillales bacterium]
MAKHDRVVVVGAGPVGSLAAFLLARAGIPVTLLEAEAALVIDYRASTIHPPTLDLLDECGVSAALVQMGLITPVMQYRDRRDGKIAEFDLTQLKNDTRHPYRLQCEQFKLVGWLYEQFAKMPNVELLLSHRVTALTQDDDGVRVTAETATGESKAFDADYVIAADGGRSAVRKLTQIDFPGFTHREHFLVAGTTFDFKSAMPDICSVNYTADPDEWYLLLEIPDMWRVILPVGSEVEAEDARSEAFIQSALNNLLPRSEPYDIVVRAVYRVSSRVAATYRAGRVFLAGDAAHINNPLGGMGMNGGLHDAISLTNHLAEVWHGRAGDAALAGYEAQRRPEAINAINAMTERNKKTLEERDPTIRRAHQDELRRIAADPALAYDHMLQTSMIASLRRSGMLG